MAGLRERRHQETKEQLVAVAFEMFIERGFDQVTMEEVSLAAGVSRSTAYRRFATKEDVVLEVPRRWLAVFDEAVVQMPDGSTLRAVVEASTIAVAEHIDDNRELVLTAYTILEGAPTLQQSGAATSAWFERMLAVVERFSDLDAETASTVAGAYLGAIDAMMQRWAASRGATSVADSTAGLVERLAPILPN